MKYINIILKTIFYNKICKAIEKYSKGLLHKGTHLISMEINNTKFAFLAKN